MRPIPFTVSAKAARLLGRENVSNADGALTELIKNCYDADATYAIVIFDIMYETVPEQISFEKFEYFCKNNDFKDNLSKCYSKGIEDYSLCKKISDDTFESLESFFNSYSKIYILDNGEGMSESIIEKQWMTIGTNNKEANFKSNNGRVRVGAKGIGRFALDRLGDESFMQTQQKDSPCCDWMIEWSSFEGEEKPIGEVNASFGESELNYSSYATEIINKYIPSDIKEILESDVKAQFNTGTLIEVSQLRDTWNSQRIKNLFRAIKTLVPPKELCDFRLFIIQSNNDNSLLGEVNSYLCDDFDYKLKAQVDTSGIVSIELQRNENDSSIMPEKLYDELNGNIESWESGIVKKKMNLAELVGSSDVNVPLYEKVGPFSIDFYYLKRRYTKRDNDKFYYKHFSFLDRNDWLETFGGIKIFRDGFRIRPYGEMGGDSFDWLGFGARQAESPAAPTNEESQWRVRPGQVAGSIHISRLNNIEFEDKASREGILHNETFDALKSLVCYIIEFFEKDRQSVFRILNRYYKSVNKDVENLEKANEIVNRLKSGGEFSENEKILSDAYQLKEDELQKVLSENQLLRRYGSVGLTISSLAHELSNTMSKLSPATTILNKYIQIGLENHSLDIDGLNTLNKSCSILTTQHQKIKLWTEFSLDSLNRDKRSQRKIDLFEYFSDLYSSWIKLLFDKSIELVIPERVVKTQKCEKRMFVIDFDSIFNNLIINSIYAMTKRKDSPTERIISIGLREDKNSIIIDYEDSGPGLDPIIKEPNIIFTPLFTTKVDKNNKKSGSGLGMWIVKSIVDDYHGEINISKVNQGFGVNMVFPITKTEGFRG
jgi:signal transduction histidine kinase